jgi:hypothetical protein
MRKIITIFIFLVFSAIIYAQEYDVLDYSFNGTPTNGIKITTNLPFQHGSQMPTIIITGYNYGKSETIGILLVWYIYNGSFIHQKASSFGAYTPTIKLANEDGKVVIFIDDKQYYNRFHVTAFAKGKGELPSWFEGWSVSDAPLGGTNQVAFTYKNKLAGDTYFSDGIISTDGNVGIGTTNTFGYKLAVNGTIGTKEVVVETTSAWPDFVFEPDYEQMTLADLKSYIKDNKHLPEIPTTAEVKENGISIGEMNAKLLQKIEELTLYIIQLEERVEKIENNN